MKGAVLIGAGLLALAGSGAAQSTVSVAEEPLTFNHPDAEIRCPVGTAKRTTKARIRDLYPDLELQPAPPAGFQPPRMVSPPTLAFPPRMHMLGVTGFVSVAVLIAPDGSIGEPQVLCSTSPDFEREALAGVATMKYSAATQDGRAVLGAAIQPFNFALQD